MNKQDNTIGIATIEDAKAEELWLALKNTRNEPTISLENIAEICKDVFREELEIFIKTLIKVGKDL